MEDFLEVLNKKILICDGATGTMLYAHGVTPGACYEYLNLKSPQLVEDLHRSYIAAGADIIETNTFAANVSWLAKFNYAKLVGEINIAAAKIARKAADGQAYVAGSIGPLDKTWLEEHPSDDQIYEVYKEQSLALTRGGVDLLILESFSNLEHIKIALNACKKHTFLPVIAQMAFLDGRHTGFGNSVAAVVKTLTEGQADVIGANCGSGPAALAQVAKEMVTLTDKYISVQPNAGYPQIVDGRLMHLSSPEYFSRYAQELVSAGVNIIGGCCGTTPEHIRLISLSLKNCKPALRQKKELNQEAVSFVKSQAFFERKDQKKIKMIVELLPPKDANTEKLIEVAAMLKSSGAQVLSFPENPLAKVRMSAIVAANLVKQACDLETVFHYTCRDRNLLSLQSDILGAYALGLRYVLAVTGDPASLGNNPEASSVFDVDSVKLVKLICNMKKEFCLDMHVGVAFNPNFDNIDAQLARLKRKIDAGAEFVMTQPVFDIQKIKCISGQLKDLGVPVYMGVLSLVNKRNAEYLHNEVPGMKIPLQILERMDIEDKVKAQQEGIAIALEIMQAAVSCAAGFYLISPLNRYEISAAILKKMIL